MHYLNILHQSSLNCWQLQYKLGEVLISNLSIKDKNQNSLLISPFVGHGNDNERKTRLERFFSYIKKEIAINSRLRETKWWRTCSRVKYIACWLCVSRNSFSIGRVVGGNEHKGNCKPLNAQTRIWPLRESSIA